MLWLPWKPHGDDEAGLKLARLKPGQGRGPRRLVPWWVGAMRRAKAASVMRRQPKTSAGGGGLRRRVAPSRMYGRRSVVKASFRRNRHNGGWVRHARYLAREQAQREHERGLGFDGTREDLDMATIVREWERRDEIVWSFIISPEDANRIDLRRHARDFVAAMERDLGTQLEWVAIDHHNTDDEHLHLLIRGVRDDGRTLTLDRDYVREALRELSRELLERELGPRSEQEYLRARERVIEREQWTEIDRTLKSRAGIERIVSYENFEPFTDGAKVRAEQEMERLAYLEKLGLARQIGERSWELAQEHEPELRRRQRENDILKTRARERQQKREREHEQEMER
jgi:type IV secretory pathway VirD2 relaxase